MTENTLPDKQHMTIVLHSGAYDRASYALSIAQTALASGKEVHMLLTFEGLRRFTKGHLGDIGEETAPTVRPYIEEGLETGAVLPLEEQLAEAKKWGLKIYACPNAMAAFNIPFQKLVAVNEVMGLTAFLNLASTANINFYI